MKTIDNLAAIEQTMKDATHTLASYQNQFGQNKCMVWRPYYNDYTIFYNYTGRDTTKIEHFDSLQTAKARYNEIFCVHVNFVG